MSRVLKQLSFTRPADRASGESTSGLTIKVVKMYADAKFRVPVLSLAKRLSMSWDFCCPKQRGDFWRYMIKKSKGIYIPSSDLHNIQSFSHFQNVKFTHHGKTNPLK